MSLGDRDWWRKDRKRKDELYGGDFSVNSKPKIKHKNNNVPMDDDTNVMNKPLSLENLLIFSVIFMIGALLYQDNIIVVFIIAILGTIISQIMKVRKEKRAEAFLKAIIYAVTIFAGMATLVLIVFLAIAKYGR